MDKFIKSVVLILLSLVSSISMKAYDSESSYQPTINVNGYYLDPTANDLVYGSMSLQVKGDKIVSYKTPFTHEYVECQIPYKKMTPHEKSQMRLTDSQGRSYELYVGNSEYVAKVGKLTVYFADYGFGKARIYSVEEVDEKPCIEEGFNRTKSIEKYIYSSRAVSNIYNNATTAIKIVVSFIVNRDGAVSDIQVLESNAPAFNNEIIRAIKGMKNVRPATIRRRHGNAIYSYEVDCRYMLNFNVQIKN